MKAQALNYTDGTNTQLREKIIECYALWNEINTYRVSLGYKNNFFTDLIHVISKYGCLKGKKEFWIPSIQKDFKKKQTQLTICLQ